MNINKREWDYTTLYQVGDPAKHAGNYTLKWALHYLDTLSAMAKLDGTWNIIHITDGKIDAKYTRAEAERILKLSKI